MQLSTEWEDFDASGQPARAYVVRPAAAGDAPLPGVLLIQEAWGVDPHIVDLAHRFARAGYHVLAPDLYSPGGTPPELSGERVEAVKDFLGTMPPGAWTDEEQRERALDALPQSRRDQVSASMAVIFGGARNLDRHIPALRSAFARLRDDSRCNGRVASVGYCMGGGLSGLLACVEQELAAAVVYYGRPPPADRIGAIRCPVLGLYGEQDERITEAVPAFAEAMAAAGKDFTHHVYPGAPHAFFNDTRPSYRVDPSRDAWARTLQFFARQLGADF